MDRDVQPRLPALDGNSKPRKPPVSETATFLVICYDVADDNRLRQVSREMENFGVRVQNSVFECYLDAPQLTDLQGRLARLIDTSVDKVRYYRLCPKDVAAIRVDGPGTVTMDWEYAVV